MAKKKEGKKAVESQINLRVRDIARGRIQRAVERVEKIGKQMAIHRRRILIDRWFGQYNPNSLIDAIDGDATHSKIISPSKQSNKSGCYASTVTISTWVDLDKYADKPRAEKWANKYGAEDDPKIYVLDQQHYYGILALPEMSEGFDGTNPTGRHGKWVNPYFNQQNEGRIPLMNVLEETLKSEEFLKSIADEAGLKMGRK